MADVKLTREEIKEIKKQRKKLRKDLKQRGIKSRYEFERIAFEMGLSLGKKNRMLGFLGWLNRIGFLLSGLGLLGGLGLMAAVMAGIFAWSTLTQERGNFTINLTGDMVDVGFLLSETEDFADPKIRLDSEKLQNVGAFSIADIPTDVCETDGCHNGTNYVAYTFYIRNEGERDSGYAYRLILNSHSRGVQKAVWIMFFDEEGQVVYAAPSDDGDGENLYGYYSAPMGEFAKDYGKQYYKEGDYYGIKATPYHSDTEVMSGIVENVAAGEMKKYTVVIWVEGDDPNCVNDILGGHAGYAMQFTLLDKGIEKDGVFDGVMTTEDDFLKQTDEINRGLKQGN